MDEILADVLYNYSEYSNCPLSSRFSGLSRQLDEPSIDNIVEGDEAGSSTIYHSASCLVSNFIVYGTKIL